MLLISHEVQRIKVAPIIYAREVCMLRSMHDDPYMYQYMYTYWLVHVRDVGANIHECHHTSQLRILGQNPAIATCVFGVECTTP